MSETLGIPSSKELTFTPSLYQEAQEIVPAHLELVADRAIETYHRAVMVSAAELIEREPCLGFGIGGRFRGLSCQRLNFLTTMSMVYAYGEECLDYLWLQFDSLNPRRPQAYTFLNVDGRRLAYKAILARRGGLPVQHKPVQRAEMEDIFHKRLNAYNPARSKPKDRPDLIRDGLPLRRHVDAWKVCEDPRVLELIT